MVAWHVWSLYWLIISHSVSRDALKYISCFLGITWNQHLDLGKSDRFLSQLPLSTDVYMKPTIYSRKNLGQWTRLEPLCKDTSLGWRDGQIPWGRTLIKHVKVFLLAFLQSFPRGTHSPYKGYCGLGYGNRLPGVYWTLLLNEADSRRSQETLWPSR